MLESNLVTTTGNVAAEENAKAARVDDASACIAYLRAVQGLTCGEVVPVARQGGCSLSFIVGEADCRHSPRVAVQFRDPRYPLSLSLANEAANTYVEYAPRTRPIITADSQRKQEPTPCRPFNFQMIKMDYVPGIVLCDLLWSASSTSNHKVFNQTNDPRKQVLSSLARFLATGWHHARHTIPHACDGKIGRSLLSRLQLLSRNLPTASLRRLARRVKRHVARGGLRNLPIVLTHGDLIPTNMLVDPNSWQLTGVIDWAEAEYLPFGIALYSVEHILGRLVENDRSTTGEKVFRYATGADMLRRGFWRALQHEIPELSNPAIQDRVLLARLVGILLWRGIAWDDGAINRVINPVEDADEVAHLHAFVDAPNLQMHSRL